MGASMSRGFGYVMAALALSLQVAPFAAQAQTQMQLPTQQQTQMQLQIQSQVETQARVPASGVSKPVQELAEGSRCGSVVIRHCRLRRETASMVLDPSLRGRNGAPMQWEVVQFGGPDNDEILVTGERIRDPAIYEVFDRIFGSPMESMAMLTRNARGGARCTTIIRSGVNLCSNPGSGLPALDDPLTDWTF